MVSEASREVLFVLTPAVAPDAKSVFDRFGSMADQAYGRMEERAARASAKVGADLDRMHKRNGEAAIAAANRVAKAEADVLEKRVNGHGKAYEKMNGDVEKSARKQSEALKKAERDYEAAAQKVHDANRSMTDSFHMAGEGLVKLGQGFAMLGLAGEEDVKKLVQGLVKVKATVDLVRGGVEIYRGLTEGVKAYRTAVLAAAAANESLAAAQAASAAAGARAAGAGAAGSAVTAGAAGAAGAAAPNALIGAILGLPGAIAIAVAGALAGGGAAIGFARDASSYGLRGGGAPGGWNATMGQWYADRFASVYNAMPDWAYRENAFSQYGQSQQAVERMQTGQSALDETIARQREQSAIQSQAQAARDAILREQRMRAIGRSGDATGRRFGSAYSASDIAAQSAADASRPGRFATPGEFELWQFRTGQGAQQRQSSRALAMAEIQGQTVRDQERAVRSELDARRREREDAEKKLTGDVGGPVQADELRGKASAARQAEAALQQQLLSVTGQRLQQEQQISEIRKSAADQSIQSTRDEIQLRQQLVEADKQRLMSAEERIAGMNEQQQAALAKTIQKARSGQTLTAEEFGQIGSLSGLSEIDSLRRKQAEERARAFMAQTGVGKEERDRMRVNEEAQKQLEIRLKDQRELRVNIERDDNALIEGIVSRVAEETERRDKALLEEMDWRLRQEMGKINQRYANTAALIH